MHASIGGDRVGKRWIITNRALATPPEHQRRRLHATLRDGRRTWYQLTNQTGAVPCLYLYDEIGFWGISAQALIDELKTLSAPRLDVHVNSPGGEVFDGLAIYNSLKSHPAEVHVYVDGLAASAASFIAQAGDRIVMARNAMMMIHNASGLCIGNASDMRELADLLDKLSGSIADIYSQRSGRPVDEWRAAMDAESWYTGAEAVAAGLADEMTDPDEAADGDRPAEMRNTWDLSIFKYAGRDAAPAPEVRGQAPVVAPDAVEPPPATGGVLRAGEMVVVGERGPEAVDLPDGATVTDGTLVEPPTFTPVTGADGVVRPVLNGELSDLLGDPADEPDDECDETDDAPAASPVDDWAAATAALTAGPDDLWAALTARITQDPGTSTVDDPFARLREALA